MESGFPDSRTENPVGNGAWVPETDAERQAVREQLDRLLASHLFSSSKRYPNLLKYVVEETLAGRGSHLKERTLGIDVFGRDPSYDTNLDPVVRTSAAQVRQRAAHYYLEESRESEIRIELLPGSYIPVFHRPGEASGFEAAVPPIPQELRTLPPVASGQISASRVIPKPDMPLPHPLPPRGFRAWKRFGLAGIFAAGLLLGLIALFPPAPADPMAAFWGPLWDNSTPLLICVPGRFPTQEDPSQTAGVTTPPPAAPGQPLTIVDSQKLNSIAWPDATSLYMLVGFIQSHGQRYVVRRERDSTLSDLRNGPTLLIGGYNNRWLMRLNSSYRFTYQSAPPSGEHWIADSQNPSRKDWMVNTLSTYSKFDQDYGIVSRVWDTTTERWVVMASGIASYGTIAAGQFLTNPNYLALIGQVAPAGWKKKSIQVVFATRVFNGYSAPPRILAVHTW